jgi:hypothetical protein
MSKACSSCGENKQENLVTNRKTQTVFCTACVNIQQNADPIVFSKGFHKATQRLLDQSDRKNSASLPARSLMVALTHLADCLKSNQEDLVLKGKQSQIRQLVKLLCTFINHLNFELSSGQDRKRIDEIQKFFTEFIDTAEPKMKENKIYQKAIVGIGECKLIMINQLWRA